MHGVDSDIHKLLLMKPRPVCESVCLCVCVCVCKIHRCVWYPVVSVSLVTVATSVLDWTVNNSFLKLVEVKKN